MKDKSKLRLIFILGTLIRIGVIGGALVFLFGRPAVEAHLIALLIDYAIFTTDIKFALVEVAGEVSEADQNKR